MIKFRVGTKYIGDDRPCFIIAEAGVNHNGKLSLALNLVDAAAKAGADAVKFQTFKAEQVVTSQGEMADYQKTNTGQEKSQLEMLQELELKENFYLQIIKRCNKQGIIFLSTPHGGRESVDFLEKFGVDVFKVGSGDLDNYLLLDRLTKTGKPLILSSGMATLQEVRDAVDFVRGRGCKNLAILHCTTNYPCPSEEVNMAAMVEMMRQLDIPVGYSDHTVGSQAAVMAVTLGAKIYECHFTLDKKLPGPDHIASADPGELKDRVDAIRLTEKMMGNKKKEPTKSEQKLISIVRRSLVAARDLPEGYKLTLKDLEAKRPGDGVSPSNFQKFIGRTLKDELSKDQQLTFDDLVE